MTNQPIMARRRLVDAVIDHFRTEISTGRLESGARLPPETKLTAQLGVSRTTLREAIVVLSHDGLVDVRQGDGTYVATGRVPERDLAGRPIAQLLEARRALVLELVALAAHRIGEETFDSLQHRAADLTAAIDDADLDRCLEAALALQRAIATAAGSDLLAELASWVSNAMPSTGAAEPGRDGEWLLMFGHLARAADAVQRRDTEAANRFARLWLAAEAARLAPDQPPMQYGAGPARRGPRAKHMRRQTDEPET